MRLFLISTIPGGYAEREFGGIQYCLNKSNKDYCHIINSSYATDDLEILSDDFFIVADYYFNPTFKIENVNVAIVNLISRLPSNQTAIYYSDPTFKFIDPSKFDNWDYFVFFGLSNFKHLLKSDFKNCKIWENIDLSTKQILNIPIPELAFWSYIKMNNGSTVFKQAESRYDISYIINSKIKSRMKLLDYLDGIKCQLGNWKDIDNVEIKKFVERNPQNKWESQKAFGLDYLYLQDGKFTLMTDDDVSIKAAWPMRFYECAAVGIIPLIDLKKELATEIYNLPNMWRCYFNNRDDILEILIYFDSPQMMKHLKDELQMFMQTWVYDFTRLYNKTVEEIKNRR